MNKMFRWYGIYSIDNSLIVYDGAKIVVRVGISKGFKLNKVKVTIYKLS